MNRPKSLALTPLLLVFLLLFPLASAFGEAAHPKQIKVGVVLGLTGIAATHADAIKKGVELAATDLRRNGWDLQLDYQDDQGNPAKTVQSIQFLRSRGFNLFIGPTWSFQVSAAQKVLSDPNVVAIVPGGSSDINGGPHPNIFSLCPPRTSELPVVTAWLRGKQFKKGFLLTPLGDWGEVHRTVYTEALKQAGIEMVADDRFDYGTELQTFVTILRKAKEKGADVVLTTGSAADDANILRARSQLHFKVAVLTSDTLRDIIHLNGIPAADPMLDDAYAIELPINPSFAKLYRERYGEAPLGFYSDRGYDALKLLADAVLNSDGSAPGVREHLQTRTDSTGMSGRIRFSKNNDTYDSQYVIRSAIQAIEEER